MYVPDLAGLRQYAKEVNLVPVYRELPADLETPVSVYLKVRGGHPSFLLESVERGEQVGRYSFIGVDPALQIRSKGTQVILQGPDAAKNQEVRTRFGQAAQGEDTRSPSLAEDQLSFSLQPGSDVLHVVKSYLEHYRPVHLRGLPRFFGGAVGYLAYDAVRFFERLPDTGTDDLKVPDAHLLFCRTYVIFDHVKHRLMIVSPAFIEDDPERAYFEAINRISAVVSRIQAPLPSLPQAPGRPGGDTTSNVTREKFEENVRVAREYIAAGDIFQVVISQRLARPTEAEPFMIYRALRMTNPSPYMVFLDLDDMQIISSSPEMHVRMEDGNAELRPIAGTHRRGQSEAEDLALEKELMADPKERAEHVMLVDLGRNDLGRVCRYGSVHVPTLMTVERYSHVMHIVSHIHGTLAPQYDAFDLLRATFPAGTVSGAPKVRAMEIIEELEGSRRGTYAGAIGYFGYSGSTDTCITIRTIVMQNGTAYVQAGAGIVADSDPGREFEESINKARGMMEAITLAEKGF
ncbi:MAG: anthranilate synthase component I [Chloroflexi bacterium]|nr:anthranilate synthase component I [Chloroflexota bacterium]